MKISARRLRQMFPFDLSTEDAGRVLTATGLEVEGIERVEDIPGGLRGVVVGHVMEVTPHPDADRLRLCKVDAGEAHGVLDIVCGASNVAAGQKVPLATIGTMIHPLEGEPFKIKKGKIRGQVSMGMICAEDELSLGTSHDGIMVLDDGLKPGTPMAEVVGLEGDDVIEIGLTPNRNDAMGHWGVARDLRAGCLHGTVTGIGPMEVAELRAPKTAPITDAGKASVDLDIQATDACPHYLAVEIHGVSVQPSPDHAQRFLRAIGVQPINNVVDATNMVLHEFGNPLHAFDLDRIEGGIVTVRRAKAGEPFVTLDGEERTLHEDDLVIADNHNPLCLAGVYGGATSGVNDTTSKVLLEAAWFDPVSVRKTAKRHTLSTDASFRFERGVDPDMVQRAAERCAHLIAEWSPGAHVVGLSEVRHEPHVKPCAVTLSLPWLHGFLGDAIDDARIDSILEALDIAVVGKHGESWDLQVPAYRSDVTRPADVAEEILRVHGFDHIPLPSRMTGTLEVPTKPNREDVLFGWREQLVHQGFSEIMSNSLTRADHAALISDRSLDPEASIAMLNPLSSELGVMRQSLLFQGLEAIAKNTNHKHADLRLFEFGRTYKQSVNEGKTVYHEEEELSLWLTGRDAPEAWNQPKGKDGQVDAFALKRAVETLLDAVGLPVLAEPDNDGLLSEGLLLRNRGGAEVGRWGLVNPKVAKACGVDAPVFWANFNVGLLWKAVRKRRVKASELARFPSVRRDLALVVDQSVSYDALKVAAERAERKLLKGVSLFDVYTGKGLESHEKSYAMAFTLQHPDATLNDKQIDAAMQRILEGCQACGARLR